MWFIVKYVSNRTQETDSLFIQCERGSNILRKVRRRMQRFLFEEKLADYRGDTDSVSEVIRFLIGRRLVSEAQLANAQPQTISELIEAVSPMYLVHDRWWIDSIEPTSDCEGCRYDCPGQRDHMDCPTGCLHDTLTCSLCCIKEQNWEEDLDSV